MVRLWLNIAVVRFCLGLLEREGFSAVFSLVSPLPTAHMGEVHGLVTLPEATEMYIRGMEVFSF